MANHFLAGLEQTIGPSAPSRSGLHWLIPFGVHSDEPAGHMLIDISSRPGLRARRASIAAGGGKRCEGGASSPSNLDSPRGFTSRVAFRRDLRQICISTSAKPIASQELRSFGPLAHND